jgi:hypothetical protein
MDLETIFQGKMTSYKWTLLGEYLKGSKVQPGAGLNFQSSTSSGTVISSIKQRDRKPSSPPAFAPLSLRKIVDSSNYLIEIQEGMVIVRATQSDQDALIYHFPKIGGVLMSNQPKPEITITDGDFIMAQYSTDVWGFIVGDVDIIAGAAQTSLHHQPPSGEFGGTEGDYYIKLLEFTIDAGAPKFKLHQQSDIEHSRLWTGRNVGSARNVHKEWNGLADKYDFRTLEQVDVPATRAGGKVIVDLAGDENLAANDAIKFSCIAGIVEPQVTVSDDGAGVITVRGNSNNQRFDFEDHNGDALGFIQWVDGLVTSGTDTITIPQGLPAGDYGDILYHNGTDWVVLLNPGAPVNTDAFQVLVHDGTAPSWTESEL